MATTKVMTNKARSPAVTGKIVRSPTVMGKYIQRSIVEVTGRKPRLHHVITVLEAKRNYSFSLLLAQKQRAEAAEIVRGMALRHNQAFKPVVPSVSYAQVARIGATPTGTMSTVPEVKGVPLISRYAARRDYTAAYKLQQQQRAEALELVKAIAARRPIVRQVKKEGLSELERLHLTAKIKAVMKARKYLKRHPAQELTTPFSARELRKAEELRVKLLDTPVTGEEVVKGVARATSIKQRKRKASTPFPETERYLAQPRKVRRVQEKHPELISFLKLKMKLWWMRRRDPQQYEEICYKAYGKLLQPQMDTSGETQKTVTALDLKSNVVIAESEQPDRGVEVPRDLGFSNLSVSKERQVFETFTDRWIKIGRYTWHSQSENKILPIKLLDAWYDTVHFPRVILEQHQDSQNAQILLNHRFFRTDLVLKFVMNSSPWQTGAVVATWTYGNVADTKRLNNVYTAFQRNHAILQAGVSNSVELVVPYHHWNSYMSNSTKQCDIGYVSLFVIVPLRFTENVAPEATISLYASLKNVDAHGLISRDLGVKGMLHDGVQGQMDTVGELARVAGKSFGVDSTLIDMGVNALKRCSAPNRDNPPKPLQPAALVPQTVPSFSYTDGVPEPINVLRANPTGQRVTVGSVTNMELRELAQGWGYLGNFNWSMTDAPEANLYSVPVAPFLSNNYYPRMDSVASGISSNVYPPIAVMSSLAGKYRGDIEYKFVIVANGFYTGTFMISAIPDVASDVPYKEATRSLSVICDIKKSSTVAIRVPWNWYNAWCPTRSMYKRTTIGLVFSQAYARLQVKVVNSLIGIDKIPPAVTVMVFTRGADNFELAQMRTPLLVPAAVTVIPPIDEYLIPYNNELALYTTSSFRAKDSSGRYWETMVVGNVSDGWVGFNNIEPLTIYRFLGKTLKGLDMRIPMVTQTGKTYVRYGVLHPDLHTANTSGPVVFSELQDAADFVDALKKGTAQSYLNNHPRARYAKDSDWSETKNPRSTEWTKAVNDSTDHPIWIKETSQLMNFEVVGQMDTEGISVRIEQPAPTTNFGEHVYGEAIPDLKGMGRRWQHYSSVTVNTCTKQYPRDCGYAVKIPIRPNRQLTSSGSYSYDNRVRDGVIPLISSAFYLTDGGMRYRIIPIKQVPDDTIIYVQHRFDDTENVQGPIIGKGAVSARDMLDTHYATYVQALSVNPVVSVEVPYYRETERLLTTFNESGRPSSNGFLYIWLHSAQKSKVQLEIYYSLADDFNWSVFQGFPPLMDITQISDEPTPQMDVEPAEEALPQSWFQKERDNLIHSADVIRESSVKITTSIEDATAVFTNIAKKFDSFIDSATSLPSRISRSHNDMMKDPTYNKSCTILQEYLNVGFNFISHIVPCIISPTPGIISWALVCLYREIFGFSLEGFQPLINLFSSLWTLVTGPSQHPQGQMDDDIAGQVCSVMFTSLCSMAKLSVSPPTSWKDVTKGLFEFSKDCRAGSMVGRFFKDNLELLRRVWKRILRVFSIGTPHYKIIAGIEDERLREWVAHASAITSPTVKEQVYTNPYWAEKVFELAVMGRAFRISMAKEQTNLPVALTRLVISLIEALLKMERDLANRKVFCGERYEPCCIWISGAAGTGKTRYLQHLANILAQESGSKCAHSYHTITFNQQYFDGFIGQDNILMDDLLTTSPTSDPAVHMFIQMKSSALFNPPFSDVKDKSTMVNFKNLLVSSNFSGVKNMAGIHDDAAYNRRRDILLRFEKSGLKETYTEQEYVDCLHIKAYHLPDPLDHTSKGVLIPRQEGVHYRKTLDDFICQRTQEYHLKESVSFSRRVREKMERLDSIGANAHSLDDYLEKCTKLLNLPNREQGLREYYSGLQAWMGDHKLPSVSGQMDDQEVYWPNMFTGQWSQLARVIGDKTLETWAEANWVVNPAESEILCDPIEPLSRKAIGWELRPTRADNKCLHEVDNIDCYAYDDMLRFYRILTPSMYVNMKEPTSFPVGQCLWKNVKGELEPLPNCIMRDPCKRDMFISRLAAHYLQDNPQLKQHIIENKGLGDMIPEDFPKEYWPKLEASVRHFKSYVDYVDSYVTRRFAKTQASMSENVTNVGDILVPKQSKWKTIPQVVWKAFLVVAKGTLKVLDVVATIVNTLLGISLLGAVGAGVYGAIQANRQQKLVNHSIPIPNLHPSGDYKTVKNRSSARQMALSLNAPNNGGPTDEELIKAADTQILGPSEDGRLKKILRNTFTLVGYVADGNEDEVTYTRWPVRCIGLEQNKFLVLKHYIEHFQSQNVQNVAVIYRKNSGCQRFRLDEIDFKWTDQGYGVGEFPSLAQPFANITKFIPSESFDGNYPSTMIMVEPKTTSVQLFELEVTKLQQPKFVPPCGSQSPWTISQGFSYEWGGKGRCMSFLFAPTLACPLVGIHTAGVYDRIGFSEILLKETFVDPDIPALDYVTPHMAISEDGFDLPGDGVVLGHVDKSEAVQMSRDTKIRPSDISGVFPEKTEPAPLRASDPRLEYPADPLVEGMKRRCDKPLELPKGDVQAAYLDYVDLLRLNARPLRTLTPLTITEAIEGLTLPGYEPMTITTSEGYPWVLDRPKGESNKSWMFKFSNYPDGRRKLDGIYTPLSDVIDLKNDMCKRDIVPFTYFTMALKDARILKEKVSIPGKTRVFEMSPVDLTIRSRQHTLDFNAAYTSHNRLRCENTIGINPDGEEWTMFADALREFSPYILTADYSGYGPRLLHSVLWKHEQAVMAWYLHYQTRQGIDEEVIDEGFHIRYALAKEALTPAHIAKDAIVKFPTGQDSGHPSTIQRNSGTNSIMIRTAYLGIMREKKPCYADMYWFKKFVLMFTNGDDFIAAVKPEIIDYFNNNTLIEYFAKFNIKMTDALKSGVQRPYCSLEEATYLKRGFLRHPTRPGQWLAPLDKNSVTDTANWIWLSADSKQASLVNSEMCARLAYTHGPEFYDYVVTKLKNAWLDKGVAFSAPSWDSLDQHVFEGAPGPVFSF